MADLPPEPELPEGWALTPGGGDEDLLVAVREAYGPGHVDGPWTDEDTPEVSAPNLPGADPPALGLPRPGCATTTAAAPARCCAPGPWHGSPTAAPEC